MILSIAGLNGGADLSGSVDRFPEGGGSPISIEANVNHRTDTITFALYDKAINLAIPERAEMWLYDTPAGSNVVDPPWAISAYNTHVNGAGSERTDTNPANWTTRLFAGYVADPTYSLSGAERMVAVSGQDYTLRMRTTIVNMAFGSGYTDSQIILAVGRQYRPDWDYSQVATTVTSMPVISFPVHSMEQFFNRVIKVSRAFYRVDYYKRLIYGAFGAQVAPFNLSDSPDGVTSFGYEQLQFQAGSSNFFNKVWIVGGRYLSGTTTYTVPVSLVDGVTWSFPLPGEPDPASITSVKINGVEQLPLVGSQRVVGVVPKDGDPSVQGGWKQPVLVSLTPAVIYFSTTPPNAATITVTGKFRYTLVQAVTDQKLLAKANGVIFESVVRDKRITDITLAQQVGKAFLTVQGDVLHSGTCLVTKRGLGGALLQPGQTTKITNQKLFNGLITDANGNLTTTLLAVITKLQTRLGSNFDEPYEVTITFADKTMVGTDY